MSAGTFRWSHGFADREARDRAPEYRAVEGDVVHRVPLRGGQRAPARRGPACRHRRTRTPDPAGRDVVLLGATGTGKSATTAWLIERLQRPTLVMAPNKTLAAQLANELREMLPHNAVEYFVSYYDYYQPEAYIAQTDTYIEKDSSINDDVERLRHSGHLRAAVAPRCCGGRLGLVHLRPGHPAVVSGPHRWN